LQCNPYVAISFEGRPMLICPVIVGV
jgi:hypothetical protein